MTSFITICRAYGRFSLPLLEVLWLLFKSLTPTITQSSVNPLSGPTTSFCYVTVSCLLVRWVYSIHTAAFTSSFAYVNGFETSDWPRYPCEAWMPHPKAVCRESPGFLYERHLCGVHTYHLPAGNVWHTPVCLVT
ncbi:hypothetical protein F5B21DRAFT_319112 [Xylaria acuta]|nr:hypothetical protein F5B21DRAFT_319112 [Xylaria acuta]